MTRRCLGQTSTCRQADRTGITPLQPSDRLSAITGATVCISANLQAVRSYAAYNLLLRLSDEELAARRGVFFCSHAHFAYAWSLSGYCAAHVPAKTPKRSVTDHSRPGFT